MSFVTNEKMLPKKKVAKTYSGVLVDIEGLCQRKSILFKPPTQRLDLSIFPGIE